MVNARNWRDEKRLKRWDELKGDVTVMAINRLAADMMRIAEILGYNINNLDLSNIGIETFTDGKAENSLIMEVVFDKQKDMEYNKIQFQIEKIYNAFMYGEQSAFWRAVILEHFEVQTQVDFMLLVSFIYMRKADIDNKESRIADSMATIAATLCKYISY